MPKTGHFDCKQFLTSRRSTRVVVMGPGTSFVLTLISIGRKVLPFQRMAVVIRTCIENSNRYHNG